jgi:hypothetical protein
MADAPVAVTCHLQENARIKLSGFRFLFERNGCDVIAFLPVASLVNVSTSQPAS